MAKKKVLLSVTNDLATDQRVQKVAQTLLDLGFDVKLVGRHLPKSLPVNQFNHHRMKLLFNKGVLFYAEYHIRLFWYLLFQKVDVLVANDLDTLLPNFIISKIKNIPLVYDSHEYYTEVPELQNNPIKKKIWTAVEAFVFKRLHHIITVNESIADIYEKKYHKKLLVVRNVPRYAAFNLELKKVLRQELNLPIESKIVIMQGAGINVSRGGEEAVAAMQYVNDALLLIVGSGDALPLLKQMSSDLNLNEKVKFVAKVPYSDLIKYTAAADVGLTLDKDNNLNYKYSLPNKLFDYFACGTPVIASALVEIEKLYKQYEFGKLVQEVTALNVAAAFNNIDPNSNVYANWLNNIKRASELECWENEEKVLIELYQRFL